MRNVGPDRWIGTCLAHGNGRAACRAMGRFRFIFLFFWMGYVTMPAIVKEEKVFSKLAKELKILRMYRKLRPIVKNHIYFLEHGEQSAWGSISEEDENVIIELTEQAAGIPGPIIEIGSLFGFTTQLIATYKPREKALIGVENFSWNPYGIPAADHRVTTKRALRYVMRHCATSIYDGSSLEFKAHYAGERPAMVFIDAEHTYDAVKNDIAWAVQLGVPLIAGHDYCAVHPGVVRAVDEAFGAAREVSGSIWWHRTRNASRP